MTPVADRASRREIAVVALLSVVPLLPFLGKALSIDAPVFVAVAEQIAKHPGDPFGFQMIWDPTSPDVWVFNRNPPLVSYWLAPWIAAFGAADVWLHVAMLPFSPLAALSFLGIARRVAGAGVAPAAALVATPAFFVLATTVMVDVALLGFLLFAVYALLRSREGGEAGWQAVAGLAAAAAGLTKYVGFCAAPLIAAGALLLCPRPVRALWRVLVPPLAIWTLWAVFTKLQYGAVHFLGSTDVVFDPGKLDPDEFWNHLATAPIFYGAALLFPILLWARSLTRASFETGLAVAGVALGWLAVTWVLPDGEPPRRFALERDEAMLAIAGLAGAVVAWGACLAPRRLPGDAVDRFLLLWIGGLLVFSSFLNWHVNAADALLAAPPVLLVWFRDPALRPSTAAAAVAVALMLPFSGALAWADMQQADAYRSAAERIAKEIGERSGRRWFVGHWGLQHYLEREGFEAVVPPQYGRSDLEVGDWVASGRNVSQIDVRQNMGEYEIQRVWGWKYETALPLRTNNADAGAGFYSHHSGYVPFAWSHKPLDTIGLGRVSRVKRPRPDSSRGGDPPKGGS